MAASQAPVLSFVIVGPGDAPAYEADLALGAAVAAGGGAGGGRDERAAYLHSFIQNAALDAVVLTGGMIKSALLAAAITRRVSWLAPVALLPEVEEMRALAAGALAALAGTEPVRRYGLEEE